MSAQLVVHGATDVGKVRAENQDFFAMERFDEARSLYVVADGMGGHNGGEIASELAVRSVVEAFGGPKLDHDIVRKRFDLAFRSAHDTIRVRSMTDPASLFGMGTTCVAVYIDGASAWWGHIGDSRIYLHNPSGLKLLTRDHSKTQAMIDAGLISEEAARTHPERNIITMALGATPILEVSRNPEPLQLDPGDRLILCTDGLTGMLTDAQIRAILDRESGAEEACRALIGAALEAGGEDNVTVVIVGRTKE
ncbi:MAG: hypothetical protein CME06_11920 [Gemmatimonadetes bacterium]|nr:hypothetical protein [Gemmatimonadota bacterium]